MSNDPVWIKALLAIHVAAGGSCLLLAPLALAFRKGSGPHKRLGMIYFCAMGALAATALAIALYRPALFFAFIAVLSFYLTFSGYRALKLKSLADGVKAGVLDWVAALIAFLVSVCLVASGLFKPAWVQHFTVPALAIGLLGVRGAVSDMYRFSHTPPDRMFWQYVHLEKFLGSYVVVWTAFSLATLRPLFPKLHPAFFLWAIVAGLPAIFATSVHYRRRSSAVRDSRVRLIGDLE